MSLTRLDACRCKVGQCVWLGVEGELTMRSFSARRMTREGAAEFCRSGELLVGLDEERSAKFCRTGDEDSPLLAVSLEASSSVEPSLDLLRERASEYVVAVFRRRVDCVASASIYKRSCVMLKPAQISRRASVEPPIGLAK